MTMGNVKNVYVDQPMKLMIALVIVHEPPAGVIVGRVLAPLDHAHVPAAAWCSIAYKLDDRLSLVIFILNYYYHIIV